MKYLALAALLSLASAQASVDFESGDQPDEGAEQDIVVAEQEDETEEDSDTEVQQYHETHDYDADTGITTMTK